MANNKGDKIELVEKQSGVKGVREKSVSSAVSSRNERSAQEHTVKFRRVVLALQCRHILSEQRHQACFE